MRAPASDIEPFRPAGAVSRITAVLGFAVFTVSVGYGVLLPFLPELVRAIVGTNDTGVIARHIGLITGIFAGAPIAFAPLWGRLSDRIGSKPVILVGLLGFAATSITPPIETSLWTLHGLRLVNGAFASAVAPAALAAIVDHTNAEARARGFAWIGIATIAGFFVGPLLSGVQNIVPSLPRSTGTPWPPLIASAALTLIAALVVQVTFRPYAQTHTRAQEHRARHNRPVVQLLLALAATAAGASAAFEVGMVVHVRNVGLGTDQLALVFAECSLVMLVAQAFVFCPAAQPRAMRLLIAPAFLAMAGGLALTPAATGWLASLLATAVVAAAGGLVLPALSYWLSLASERGHGAEQGRRTAVISLGQTIGSIAAGFLFGPKFLPDAPFLAAAIVTGLAGLAALFLTSRLAALEPVTAKHPSYEEPQNEY